jgi:transposase
MRVIGPDRAQLRWDMVDLDSQLPEDHRARMVWVFVEGLDLGEFYDRIKARDETAGRPATDPRVILAVWLYARLEGIGSARAVDRLCRRHTAYRWLCGGAPVNHDLLSGFRRDGGDLLDGLLSQSDRADRGQSGHPGRCAQCRRTGVVKASTAPASSPRYCGISRMPSSRKYRVKSPPRSMRCRLPLPPRG